MGGKPWSLAASGLKARILFEGDDKTPSVASICRSEGSVFILAPTYRQSRIYRLDELSKRKMIRQPPGLFSLALEGDRWIAGGEGGVFLSSDAASDNFDADWAAVREHGRFELLTNK